MSSEAICSLTDVGVSYSKRIGMFRRQRFWALQDVNLTINRGERIGVIGINGSGKSTLLRLLARVIEPNRGTHEVSDIAVGLLAIGVGIVPHLTGRENAMLSGMLLGVSKSELREKMDVIADFAELGDAFDNPVFTYSSGMRVRLGFSVSCLARPDLLLLDEVLGVGDASFREKSERAMRDRFDGSSTIVLVSHSAGAIQKMCERVIWLHDRTVRLDGDAETVVPAYLEELERIRAARKSQVKGGDEAAAGDS